nr:2'-5' RNA ligase family protein [Aureimonas ureilytica]
MNNESPLILTLRLDAALGARFERERRQHFPPKRNLIPAHLTLFHALPGSEEPGIIRHLRALADETPPLPLRVSGFRFLGRGVAYEIESPALLTLRGSLAQHWKPWLTPQDAQGFRPHVTVQNKVEPEAARSLLQHLQAGFEPIDGSGTGLLLWRYLGGPWELAAEFSFPSDRT